MKKYVILVFLFLGMQTQAQKDSIVTYVTSKGKIVAKDKAQYYEVITKEKEDRWLVKRFIKNNHKLIKTSYYKSKNKKGKIGKATSYNLKGKVTGIRYYDINGKKEGEATRWFDDGKINLKGVYKHGKQEGVWSFYHTNGKLAAEKLYKNGELESETFYDERGKKLKAGDFINRKEAASFKGGKEKYHKKLKTFNYKLRQFRKEKKITYKLTGNIVVRYVVDIDGKIKEVSFDEPLPKDMKDFIVNWFENLKGWKPAMNMNRRVPKNKTQSINFNKKIK